jgi:hypothetical protein
LEVFDQARSHNGDMDRIVADIRALDFSGAAALLA